MVSGLFCNRNYKRDFWRATEKPDSGAEGVSQERKILFEFYAPGFFYAFC